MSAKPLSRVPKTPGPGHYKDAKHATLHASPQFKVGTGLRTLQQPLNYFPGAKYEVAAPAGKHAKSIGFGTEKKLPVKKGGVPGPGSYRLTVQVGNTPEYLNTARDPQFKRI